MGIFNRVKNIVTSGANDLLDQLESPIRSMNHSIRDLEKKFERGQDALATQIFLENKQIALIAEAEQLLAKRERQAKLAVEQGEEQVAKIAIQEKLLLEKKLSIYKEQLVTIQEQTAQLQAKLSHLNKTYEEMNHKRLLLVSRSNVAHSVRDISCTLNSFSTEEIARDFARAEDRVLFLEAKLEAGQRMKTSSPYIIDVTVHEEVEEELKKLKEGKSE
ncbi:PspA/IM30 family protein [Brevibacillus ginsengisoli]|uniref:PspA/IM30 family protein n=1 Tax=Brevibacillus ginsengisoli TaxID=363854 RepID=UPI003CEDCAB1